MATPQLKAFLAGREAQNAPADFGVYLTEHDVQAGVPGDPSQCAFAQAFERMVPGGGSLFYGTVVYLDFPGEGVLRFHAKGRTRELIAGFDDPKQTEVGIGWYRLSAPTAAFTKENLARAAAARKEREENGEDRPTRVRRTSTIRGSAQYLADHGLTEVAAG